MTNETFDTPLDILFERWQTSEEGLSSGEALLRLEKYGFNEAHQNKGINFLSKLFSEFANPLTLILLIIALISFFLGEKASAFFILIMALMGSIISFVQEYNAEKTVQKLNEMVRVTTPVYRDGVLKKIQLKEIVPGDIVALSAGVMVPADIRIISAKDLFVNESALTGESFPVEKKVDGEPEHIQASMGTSVVSGNGLGLVLKTGKLTEFGKIASELTGIKKATSFEKGINGFVVLMIKVIVILAIVIFVINFFGKNDFFGALLFALAIAVGLVPEMLPVLIAASLSKGAMAMSKKKVIIKRLNSIENFGAMDILCMDKTGTLTEAKIGLIKYCDVVGADDETVLELAYINSYFQTGLNNILDQAIIDYKTIDIKSVKRIDEVPFDFTRKLVSVIVERGGSDLLITKGSPEEIFKISSEYEKNGQILKLTPAILAESNKIYQELSQQGFRVIALAYKKPTESKNNYTRSDEKDLIFKGLIAFLDPPKATAMSAIQDLQKLGVELKILSGDNELVCRKICQAVGLVIKGVISGESMQKIAGPERIKLINEANLFVRMSPMQKQFVIETLQSEKHTVGFLGDGINDSLSLRASDVGISVNNGADIAKETANIVLLEKDLGVLKDCIMEGRRTFANILKYLKMGASSNFGNMFSLTGASLLLPFLPLLPVQIILNNLIYDFCQLTIPTDNVDPEDLIKPKPWNLDFIKKFMIGAGIISSIFDFLTFGVLWFIFHASPELFRTGWFIESLATQTLVVLIIRTRKIPFIQSRPSLLLLWSSFVVVLIGLLITLSPLSHYFGFSSPPTILLLALGGIIVLYLVTVQLFKNLFIKKYGYE